MSDNNNILNNIDRTQTWVDVETVAKLKGITKRGVRLSLNQNKYEYKVENVRGGKTYKIKLSTLEEEYQIKYSKKCFVIKTRTSSNSRWTYLKFPSYKSIYRQTL